MRRMKGTDFTKNTIATALVVSFFIFAVVFAVTIPSNVHVTLGIEKEKFYVIDLTHLAKKCFITNGYINESLLNEERFNECEFPWDAFIQVKDLETKWDWKINAGSGKTSHRIFVPILRRSGEIHLGELYVKI